MHTWLYNVSSTKSSTEFSKLPWQLNTKFRNYLSIRMASPLKVDRFGNSDLAPIKISMCCHHISSVAHNTGAKHKYLQHYAKKKQSLSLEASTFTNKFIIKFTNEFCLLYFQFCFCQVCFGLSVFISFSPVTDEAAFDILIYKSKQKTRRVVCVAYKTLREMAKRFMNSSINLRISSEEQLVERPWSQLPRACQSITGTSDSPQG